MAGTVAQFRHSPWYSHLCVQALLVALLFAVGLHRLGERGKPLLGIIDQVASTFFGIVMKRAPIGASGSRRRDRRKEMVGTAT